VSASGRRGPPRPGTGVSAPGRRGPPPPGTGVSSSGRHRPPWTGTGVSASGRHGPAGMGIAGGPPGRPGSRRRCPVGGRALNGGASRPPLACAKPPATPAPAGRFLPLPFGGRAGVGPATAPAGAGPATATGGPWRMPPGWPPASAGRPARPGWGWASCPVPRAAPAFPAPASPKISWRCGSTPAASSTAASALIPIETSMTSRLPEKTPDTSTPIAAATRTALDLITYAPPWPGTACPAARQHLHREHSAPHGGVSRRLAPVPPLPRSRILLVPEATRESPIASLPAPPPQ